MLAIVIKAFKKKLGTWFKFQRFEYNTKTGVCTANYDFLSVSHSVFLLVTWNMSCIFAVEFRKYQLILTCSLWQKCKKCYWKFLQSLWKLSEKEFFSKLGVLQTKIKWFREIFKRWTSNYLIWHDAKKDFEMLSHGSTKYCC